MARAGTLAGLAALGTAAYLMSKGKDKDKDEPKGKEDTGPGYKSTETRLESPAESIAKADKSDKSSSISTKGASGTTTLGPDTSAPKLDTQINKPVETKPAAPPPKAADNTTAAAIPSGIMGGARQPTSTVSSSEEGMKNYKPRRTPAASTVSSSEEGMRDYKPRRPVPPLRPSGMKKGGTAKKMASGGMTASKRADGIASRGKTKCKMY